ncbi:alpha/beta fold hydrolase [Shuttleworthella sp. MSX8B]|uniref:alpha/beta fold hydrolase n=1 Tax=Shuttleworthella sp. MSX8B TaxID=936574 RepID=UPI0004B7DD77|nr:alpha/beta hydrolase [Shuttleworthia sp. MSX8B]
MSENPTAEKQTLFFLHGLTADHRLFEGQIPYFEDNYNVLVWDMPGHGKSRPFSDFSMEKAGEIVRRIFLERKIKDAVFIGQSMGGYVAQSVIKRFPDLVRALVAIDSSPYGEGYYSKSDQWWLRQTERLSKLYPSQMLRREIAKRSTASQHAREHMLEMLAPYGEKELCHLMGRAYESFLDDNSDIAIKCPVLLIVGEKDITGKVRQYNRAWSKKMGFPLQWVANAAHNANDDQPEIVNEMIAAFIRSL